MKSPVYFLLAILILIHYPLLSQDGTPTSSKRNVDVPLPVPLEMVPQRTIPKKTLRQSSSLPGKLTSRSIAICFSEEEPNNEVEMATFISGTEYQNDSMCLTSGDQDWFELEIEETIYYILIEGYSAQVEGNYGLSIQFDGYYLIIETYSINSSETDTKIQLFDSDLALIKENDLYPFAKLRYAVNPPDLTAYGYLWIDGSWLHGNIVVLNLGVSPTLGESTVIFYLTAEGDYIRDIDSIIVPILNPGDSIEIPFNIDLLTKCGGDPCIDPGTYFLNYEVDVFRNSGEENRSNNFRWWPNHPIEVTEENLESCNDEYEFNNTSQLAYELTGDLNFNDTLCFFPGDYDWFSFEYNEELYYLELRSQDFARQGEYILSIHLNDNYLQVNYRDLTVEASAYIDLYKTSSEGSLINISGDTDMLNYFFSLEDTLGLEIIYVDSSNVGQNIVHNGSSWENAFTDLQDALAIVDSGDQIWIAKGMYFPTSCNPCRLQERRISFQVPQYVKLIGGFNGQEATLLDRKIDSLSLFHTNATILSGNIGNPETRDDNSQVIMQLVEIDISDQYSEIDGLIFEEGYIGDNLGGFSTGNIYVSGMNVKFNDCIFRDNKNHVVDSDQFGEVVDCDLGLSSFTSIPEITFHKCYFMNNLCRNVISIEGAWLKIDSSKFANNSINIFFIWNNADAIGFDGKTIISNSIFDNNNSLGRFRGPMDLWISNSVFKNITESGFNFDLISGGMIDNTQFINNGGAVISYLSPLSYLNDDFPIDGVFEEVDTLKMSNCKFVDCDSLAINFNYGRLELISTEFNNSRIETRNADLFALKCVFQNNANSTKIAGVFGGGIENVNSNSEIISSTFTNNQIEGGYSIVDEALVPTGGGGAIYNKGGNHFYLNCNFERNVSLGKGGGAIYSDEADIRIRESYFLNNRAEGLDIMALEFLPGNGGAIFCANGNTLIENSTIENNFASGNGGGFWIGISSGGIFNQNYIDKCIALSNKSNGSGGGGYLAGPSILKDSYFSTNSSKNGGGLTINGLTFLLGTTISHNQANNAGGGILSSGKLELSNSTIYDNNSTDGGGIFCDKNTPFFNETETTFDALSINYSTIFSNEAATNGNNIKLNTGDSLYIKNSLFAGDGPSISSSEGSFALSEGYNLISDTTGSNIRARSTDIVGGSSEPIDPRLDSLKMNGGPVPTLALLAHSPAISSGEFIDSTSTTTDQRGYSRVIGSSNNRIDIGAYEYQESTIIASEIQVCQYDNESLALGPIRLTDSTGGAWAIGENQSFVLRFPKGILIQDNPTTRVEAIGEGITIVDYEILERIKLLSLITENIPLSSTKF